MFPLRLAGLVLASIAVPLTLIGCTSDEVSTTTRPTSPPNKTQTTVSPVMQTTMLTSTLSTSTTTVVKTMPTASTTAPTLTTTKTLTLTEVVSLTFRLQNVDFDGLVSNSTLLAAFRGGVQKAIAQEVEAGILPQHVVVEVLEAQVDNSTPNRFLSKGRRRLENASAVDVQVDVHHPDGANDVVLANLGTGDNASESVLSSLEQTPGMSLVLQGPVQIQVLHTPSRTERGQVYQIPVGNLRNGVGCQDGVAGAGFLMYSSNDVHTRFAGNPPHRDNADHFVCVKYEGGWKYDTNEEWKSFTPTSTDVLVATVDFSGDTVSDLQGTKELYQGIAKGYVSGDLGFIAQRWRGSVNDGEFTVTGSGFDPNEFTSTSTTTTTTTTTRTTSTTTITTTTTTTMFVCPALAQGQSCQGNNADSVWKWMADNSFGMGPSYHGTVRPDIDYSQVPHGTCLEFGCVSDWKYQQTGTKATLQCRDGLFTVVGPANFQHDADHKCTWL